MSLEEIHNAIPHREPFLMVDRIIEKTDSHIECEKHFSGEEYFYAGHFPSFPITPGVLLCEAAMQAGAILLSGLMTEGDGRIPVATRMNDIKFKHMVRPGQTIRILVDLTERLADAFFMKAKVTCEGKVAVRFEFACALVPKDS